MNFTNLLGISGVSIERGEQKSRRVFAILEYTHLGSNVMQQVGMKIICQMKHNI